MMTQDMDNRKRILIIGAGLGGLFTGAILAHEGYQVTVLEKNTTIGGGLQTFTRFGELFDTGMHVIGGMRPEGNIRRICRYLGIEDELHIKDVDDDCTDLLYFAEDGARYAIASGREGFIKSLARYFPESEADLRAYVEAIFRLTDEADLFHLRPSADYIPTHSEEFAMAADAFIARYIRHPRLRSVIAYMNPLYGGRADETPAYIHAIINVLYINGPSRFSGGSSRFADSLAEVIRRQGGEVITREGATHVEVVNREVCFVEGCSGRRYEADYYISAIHPSALIAITTPGGLPKAYCNRLESVPNAYSAFSLYIKLRPKSFPYINHSEYYMSRYDDIWQFGNPAKQWPLGFLFMTPPDDDQGPWASRALLTVPMLFDEVRQWENTRVGHRGIDYEAWKQARQEQLLKLVDELHPGFSGCIESVNASSPLTIRDFYGVKEGSICGFSKDYHNLALTQLPVVTKVRNLLLTGQYNNLHGFCGVPLTAINTAEVLLGKNYVVNRINESIESQEYKNSHPSLCSD